MQLISGFLLVVFVIRIMIFHMLVNKRIAQTFFRIYALLYIYLFKEINIFFQQGCIKLIKSDKDIYNVRKDFYFK